MFWGWNVRDRGNVNPPSIPITGDNATCAEDDGFDPRNGLLLLSVPAHCSFAYLVASSVSCLRMDLRGLRTTSMLVYDTLFPLQRVGTYWELVCAVRHIRPMLEDEELLQQVAYRGTRTSFCHSSLHSREPPSLLQVPQSTGTGNGGDSTTACKYFRGAPPSFAINQFSPQSHPLAMLCKASAKISRSLPQLSLLPCHLTVDVFLRGHYGLKS